MIALVADGNVVAIGNVHKGSGREMA